MLNRYFGGPLWYVLLFGAVFRSM